MILDEAVSLAKQQSRSIVESGEEHIPLLLVLTPSGLGLVRPVVKDKNTFKSALTELLVMLSASAYVMIYGAWSTRIDKDSPLLDRILSGELAISELPLDDREEILTITAVDNGKSYRCWAAKISYDHDNRHLGEWKEMPKDGAASGRMVLKEW